MSKAQKFQCPSCGAALDNDNGDDPTVRCPYCDGSVIVPEELRNQESTDGVFKPIPPPIQIKLPESTQPKKRTGGCVGMFIALGVIGLIIGGAIVAVVMTTGNSMIEMFNPQNTSSFAQVALTFGSEGTGPGLFTDARHIAVDGEGNIYVGEYEDGRVQVFDAAGEFVSLWMVDTETPLVGLAADRQGTVYVVQGGWISRYEGATGQLLGQVEYAEGRGFEDVAVTADGELVAAWRTHRDDIVRFDAQGNTILTIPAAISEQSGDKELDTRVAVDGLGNIYALGSFNDAVFKFTPDGKFVSRFGSKGNDPGQFRAPRAIAVDGQGRVYVGDSKGVQVFDADGRYIDVIAVDGPVFGIVFNDQNELLVASRHKMVKYVLQP
ncbi:MAG: hypothetical protein GY832_29475 [Chloroflexi bacterium]|nr:hypothetical protein [Chloroflexota bacterium]